MKVKFFILFLFSGLVIANELEKEIKYIGNDGVKETHQIFCINEKTGIVEINNASQEMTVITSDSAIEVNIGKATFTEAAEIICE